MRHYFKHIMDNSPSDKTKKSGSLLARIYGVFSIKMEGQAPVNLILMGSSTICPDYAILKMFDLKGSITKRLSDWSKAKNTSALKDENFLKLKNLFQFVHLRESDRELILKNMSIDVDFLQLYDVMDYSLLLVVAYNEKYVEKHKDDFEQDDDGNLIKPYREKNFSPDF